MMNLMLKSMLFLRPATNDRSGGNRGKVRRDKGTIGFEWRTINTPLNAPGVIAASLMR